MKMSMDFVCQREALEQLRELAASDRHSILIEGVEGSGKTHLAFEYGRMIDVPDVIIVEPTVQSVRDAVESCCKLDNRVVICIENLDKGVVASSYALLKFLEEPASNVYIVVTCQNINKVPDTIISRSVCVVTSPPIDSDIELFAIEFNAEKYHNLKDTKLWKCVKTFRQALDVINLTPAQADYFKSLEDLWCTKDTVSNIVWKLGHYPDNSEAPVNLIMGYLVETAIDDHERRAGIECMKELSQGRIASHAALAKFVFERKYGC